jgi:hypothetical protein
MKKLLIGLVLMAVGACLYVASFRTACLQKVSAGNNSDYRMVVGGIGFPYSPAAGRAFSSFYWPLIEYYALREPQIKINGSIWDFDEGKTEISIRDQTQGLILLHVPPAMKSTMKSLKEGDSIRASYLAWPKREQPFMSEFRLLAISKTEVAGVGN